MLKKIIIKNYIILTSKVVTELMKVLANLIVVIVL